MSTLLFSLEFLQGYFTKTIGVYVLDLVSSFSSAIFILVEYSNNVFFVL